MGRTDMDQYIFFDVPYQETAGLPLVSGAYRFSVWIKAEIDGQVTPGVSNRYRASGIVLEIDDDITDIASGTQEAIYLSISDQWTRISVTKPDVFIDNDPLPADTDTMIQLRITPITTYTGGGSMPLGSLLVAEPTLELSY